MSKQLLKKHTFSYQTIGMLVWNFVSNHTGNKSMVPPTIVVDWDDPAPETCKDSSVVLAECKMGHLSLNDYEITQPTDIRIVIHHQNLLYVLDQVWQNKIPYYMLSFVINRMLAHEMLHYITDMRTYASYRTGNKTYRDYAKTVREYYGSFDDEMLTEGTCMLLMHDMYLDVDKTTMMNTTELRSYENRPFLPGGNFDQFMLIKYRKDYPKEQHNVDALRYYGYSYQRDFICQTIEDQNDLADAMVRIANKQQKQFDKDPYAYDFVD